MLMCECARIYFTMPLLLDFHSPSPFLVIINNTALYIPVKEMLYLNISLGKITKGRSSRSKGIFKILHLLLNCLLENLYISQQYMTLPIL